jgi:predicted dehydrogenase
LGIPKAYGSYDALLDDPAIDAVYIPLPNHLHVPWTIRAAEAGKHVLCEKPIGLSAAEAAQLVAVRDRTGVQIEEAFMVRTHPQWLRALDMVRSGRIGPVRSIAGFFSYFNDDASNVRNVTTFGGGGLLDIGCYLVNTARMIFQEEPRRVCALIEEDPVLHVDRLSSMLLDFPSGHAIGTCSTQLAPAQSVAISGTRGRIEVEIPFNAPPDRPCRLAIENGSNLAGSSREHLEIETCDQYTIQGDLFSRAVRHGASVPYPLEDSISNLRVIDSLFRSARAGAWEPVETDPMPPPARRR